MNALVHWLPVVAVLAAAVVLFGGPLLYQRVTRPRVLSDAGNDACAACGSRDLEVEGPGVYTCRACGYEGGSGRAARDTESRIDAWASRPAADRVLAARDDLTSAGHLIESLEGDAGELLDALRLRTAPDAFGSSLHSDDQRLADTQLAIENLFARVIACFARAAEKVPEIEVPKMPAFAGGVVNLAQSRAEVSTHIGALRRALAQSRTILELVPVTDPPASARGPTA